MTFQNHAKDFLECNGLEPDRNVKARSELFDFAYLTPSLLAIQIEPQLNERYAVVLLHRSLAEAK
jgi:hypothetical protein